MNSSILAQIKNKNLLKNSLIGVERESLRVNNNGYIATSLHPVTLGSTLTHPYITTDFAESLIEIVTPPLKGAKATLNFLHNTLQFIYANLPNNENFWANSMPCVNRGKTEIQIAKYGNSNNGKMKEIYRRGLANRYGATMQTVAGIHFNYSFSDYFWKNYQRILQDDSNLQDFKNTQYMGLTRNVLRYGWIIYYLFGASSCICKSFVNNYYKHNLINFDKDTLYEKYATSLRMGDIGYKNSFEDEKGVKENYNNIAQYTHGLQDAMQNICEEYAEIGVKKYGEYLQLNTNILQIENEYYSSVRPKPKLELGIMPSISLQKNGIAYIELRGIDINPLNPLGIDEEQILFLENFLLFCLLKKSPPISSSEQVKIDSNNNQVAHNGRNKKLLLQNNQGDILLTSWASKIMQDIANCASNISDKHQNVITILEKKINNSNLTTSKIILDKMHENNQSFNPFINDLSKKYKNDFQKMEINKEHFEMLFELSKKSIIDTKQVEKNDVVSFDKFLANYFKQLD